MKESPIQYFVVLPAREQFAASPMFKNEHMIPPQSRGMSLNGVAVVPIKTIQKETKTMCEIPRLLVVHSHVLHDRHGHAWSQHLYM